MHSLTTSTPTWIETGSLHAVDEGEARCTAGGMKDERWRRGGGMDGEVRGEIRVDG